MAKQPFPTFPNYCMIRVEGRVRVPENPEGVCGYHFDSAALSIPVLGEDPSERAVRIVRKMGEHLWSAHPAEYQSILKVTDGDNNLLKAFLIARAFQIHDPNGVQHLAMLRMQILMMVGRVFITDQQLSDLVSSMDLGPDVSSRVLQKMQYIRNVLIEVQPAQQPESALVSG